MERAGQAAFSVVEAHWPECERAVVFCGGGNNGGDGYVLARCLSEVGIRVRIYALVPIEDLQGEAKTAAMACQRARIPIEIFEAKTSVEEPDLVVDALLGTGFKGTPAPLFEAAIRCINALLCPVLAIDLPSGLNGDTGVVLGVAVKADVTVSFIGLKRGCFTADAKDYTGTLEFSDLQVDPAIYAMQSISAERLGPTKVKNYLKKRKQNSHKGDFGHVLVVGGAPGYLGAVIMAGVAALRVGAGKVSVVTTSTHAPFVATHTPEIMAHGGEDPEKVKALIEIATTIVIGPGLGQDRLAKEWFDAVLSAKCPKVLDADALSLLARMPRQEENWILTPHPKEAACLLSTTTEAVQQDRFSALEALNAKYGGSAVLKGSGTLVGEQGRTVGLCDLGNPGMATAGMGDILSGILGGILAQGLSPPEAARLGVVVHATAGDRAAKAGESGLMACDLLPVIGGIVG